jgi:hypothetical protein
LCCPGFYHGGERARELYNCFFQSITTYKLLLLPALVSDNI